MLIKPLRALKKRYRQIRVILSTHPIFCTIDKIKLSKIKKHTKDKSFVLLKPKGWKHNIKIRKNYTDREVVHYVVQGQYHLPPKTAKIPYNPIILDLGSNIGLTIAHMKHLYPNAQIIGYEMNTENYFLAKRNTEFYNDVVVNNEAIWIEDTFVTYISSSNYDAFSITNQPKDDDITKEIKVKSTCLASVIKNYKLTHIDYIKIDIEGAEKAILKSEDLSWMNIVQSMNIEMHLDENENIDDYIKIISDKGFNSWKDDYHFSSIFAVRQTK